MLLYPVHVLGLLHNCVARDRSAGASLVAFYCRHLYRSARRVSHNSTQALSSLLSPRSLPYGLSSFQPARSTRSLTALSAHCKLHTGSLVTLHIDQ